MASVSELRENLTLLEDSNTEFFLDLESNKKLNIFLFYQQCLKHINELEAYGDKILSTRNPACFKTCRGLSNFLYRSLAYLTSRSARENLIMNLKYFHINISLTIKDIIDDEEYLLKFVKPNPEAASEFSLLTYSKDDPQIKNQSQATQKADFDPVAIDQEIADLEATQF